MTPPNLLRNLTFFLRNSGVDMGLLDPCGYRRVTMGLASSGLMGGGTYARLSNRCV
ncbi:MAG: hypothetical protein QOJ80_1431 [Mycobacterium sp.]|nr:hypothetical protein [Mycobacterium sp.]